jgi:hypothetical protein
MCEKCESGYYEEPKSEIPNKAVMVDKNCPDVLIIYPDLMSEDFYDIEWLGKKFKVQRVGQFIRLLYNSKSVEFDYFNLKLFQGIPLKLNNQIFYVSKTSLGVVSIMLWKT